MVDPTCSHIENDVLNNHISNLCWESRADNTHRKIADGTSCRGESHALAKISLEIAQRIYDLAATGNFTSKEIVEAIGDDRVTVGIVHGISQGIAWPEIVRHKARCNLPRKRGPNGPNLPPKHVYEIRNMMTARRVKPESAYTVAHIAKIFKVSDGTCRRIDRRETHKHL
jgi:hypothetical protein